MNRREFVKTTGAVVIGAGIAGVVTVEATENLTDTFHRVWDGVWHNPQETIEVITNLFSEDFLYHVAPLPEPLDKPNFIQMVLGWQKAFPDGRMEILDLVVDGKKVWCYWVSTGTHSDVYVGIPATGKSVNYKGVEILRFTDDGKVAEAWTVPDVFSLMNQLNAA